MQARMLVLAGSILAGVFWVGALSLMLPSVTARGESALVDLLIDGAAQNPPFPFTIQNLMWIVFFVGAGELFLRYVAGSEEARQFELGFLPQDAETMLGKKNVSVIYRHVRKTDPDARHWLQGLLTRVSHQFLGSGSVDQVNSVFNSSMELYQHEVDLRYHMLRYVAWLIPTLGFVGTVYGIALALNRAGVSFADENLDMSADGPRIMGELTGLLSVAFYTTLLALLLSAVLMFALHLLQLREEGVLNRVGQYCLKNFINRLYEQGS